MAKGAFFEPGQTYLTRISRLQEKIFKKVMRLSQISELKTVSESCGQKFGGLQSHHKARILHFIISLFFYEQAHFNINNGFSNFHISRIMRVRKFGWTTCVWKMYKFNGVEM